MVEPPGVSLTVRPRRLRAPARGERPAGGTCRRRPFVERERFLARLEQQLRERYGTRKSAARDKPPRRRSGGDDEIAGVGAAGVGADRGGDQAARRFREPGSLHPGWERGHARRRLPNGQRSLGHRHRRAGFLTEPVPRVAGRRPPRRRPRVDQRHRSRACRVSSEDPELSGAVARQRGRCGV